MFPSVGEQVAIRIIVANHENKVRRQAIGMVLWAAVVKICPLYPKRVLLNLILLVEQNAKKALNIADRAYVLETGNIILQGDAKKLMNDESVKKAYLGE